MSSPPTTPSPSYRSAGGPGPAADSAVVRRYLELLIPDPEALPAGCVVAVSRTTESGAFPTEFFPAAGGLDPVVAHVVDANRNACVYLRMSALGAAPPAFLGGRGRDEDTVAAFGYFADVDIGELGHKGAGARPGALEEALDALDAVFAPEIAPSLIVASGGGFYPLWLLKEAWILDSPMERERYRHQLRRVQAHLAWHWRERGWTLDSTGDLSRVLRVAGTINRKLPDHPRPTGILREQGARFDPTDLEDFLLQDDVLGLPVRGSVTAQAAVVTLPGAFPPADLPRILDACAFMRHVRDDAVDLPEPHWAAGLTVVAACAGAERWGHELSQPYAKDGRRRYSYAATKKKLAAAAKVSPVTCRHVAALDGLGFPGCATCPAKAADPALKSPVQLGRDPAGNRPTPQREPPPPHEEGTLEDFADADVPAAATARALGLPGHAGLIERLGAKGAADSVAEERGAPPDDGAPHPAEQYERAPGGDGDGRGGEKQKQADAIIALVEEVGVELFHSLEDVPHATFVAGGARETLRLRDGRFRSFLSRLYYERTGTTPGSQALQDALGVLTGRALYGGAEHDVHVRLAGGEGSIYLDLADPARRVVRITAAGWVVLPGTDVDVRFRRPKGLLALPDPASGGSLEALRTLTGLTDDTTWRLVEGYLVQAANPKGPYPVLNVEGPQGATKSTLQRMLRRTIDPNTADLRSQPKEPRDLAIAAGNGWCIGLDNLSHVSGWLSDCLCRLSTGGGFGVRQLYSDAEEELFDAQRPILLNGITRFVTRGDLLDRTVTIELPRMGERDPRRRTERALWAEFRTAHPAILGALLTALAGGLERLATTTLPYLPRMADFATWVAAVEPSLGHKAGSFLPLYDGNRSGGHQRALDADVLAAPLVALVREGQPGTPGAWEGDATGLLAALGQRVADALRGQPAWPKQPNTLIGRLNRLAPALEAVEGIALTTGAGHTGRYVVLTSQGQNRQEIDRRDRRDRRGEPVLSGEAAGAATIRDDPPGPRDDPRRSPAAAPPPGGDDRDDRDDQSAEHSNETPFVPSTEWQTGPPGTPIPPVPPGGPEPGRFGHVGHSGHVAVGEVEGVRQRVHPDAGHPPEDRPLDDGAPRNGAVPDASPDTLEVSTPPRVQGVQRVQEPVPPDGGAAARERRRL